MVTCQVRDRVGRDHAGVNWKTARPRDQEATTMIRKLTNGTYRLYSRKKHPRTGKRRNLGTFRSRAAAERHERAVQYFKRAR